MRPLQLLFWWSLAAIGTLLRWCLPLAFSELSDADGALFSAFLPNICACFLLGLLKTLAAAKATVLPSAVVDALSTALCGSLSTFSGVAVHAGSLLAAWDKDGISQALEAAFVAVSTGVCAHLAGEHAARFSAACSPSSSLRGPLVATLGTICLAASLPLFFSPHVDGLPLPVVAASGLACAIGLAARVRLSAFNSANTPTHSTDCAVSGLDESPGPGFELQVVPASDEPVSPSCPSHLEAATEPDDSHIDSAADLPKADAEAHPPRAATHLPFYKPGTFAANIIGTVQLALATRFLSDAPLDSGRGLLLIAASLGLCGCLTTFSTFSGEVIALARCGGAVDYAARSMGVAILLAALILSIP
jgi:fluoride ion exporter CrcB/FEX